MHMYTHKMQQQQTLLYTYIEFCIYRYYRSHCPNVSCNVVVVNFVRIFHFLCGHFSMSKCPNKDVLLFCDCCKRFWLPTNISYKLHICWSARIQRGEKKNTRKIFKFWIKYLIKLLRIFSEIINSIWDWYSGWSFAVVVYSYVRWILNKISVYSII